MVKLGLEIVEDKGNINIKLIDPTKKQLETASENEKFIAQKFKDLFDNGVITQEEFDEKKKQLLGL